MQKSEDAIKNGRRYEPLVSRRIMRKMFHESIVHWLLCIVVIAMSAFPGTIFAQTNYSGSWNAAPALTTTCPSVSSNYTLSAVNPGSGSGTSNSYVPTGNTITIVFPSGFNLNTVSSGNVNGNPIGTITKTATTISFPSPTSIAKGASISILLNGITNSASAGNYQLSMGIVNATGGTNMFSASASSQFTISSNATISLTSAGTNIQSVCTNTAISPITYTIGGGGTNATVTGLPPGVAGTYNGGVFTISGTPTAASGTYTYTVTTTGTCAQSTATGTITVNPVATITLTSGAGSNSQSICVNTTITPITYSVAGGGTGATITGLPSGVTAVYNAGTVTISGTPTSVAGTYSYTVTTTGTCAQATATGMLTVKPDATISLMSASGTNTQAICINTSIANITYAIGGGGNGAMVTGLPTGINWLYNAGTLTISGTPTAAAGVYNYTVTTTGTCTQANATGTITIKPDATLSLTSGAGTDDQSICVNTTLTPITYSIGAGGNGALVTGLPTGVTASYNAGSLTISGTPTAAPGTYHYTVTTTGTCNQATANGTITLKPDATISLTSGPATNTQSICINTAITTITYSIGGGGNGATVTGLPAGITASYSAGILTIGGSPTAAGVYNYTVTTTGTCTQVTATGTITIKPDAAITLTSAAATSGQFTCLNNSINDIIYTVTGNATGASVTGLPAGVSGIFSGQTFTISGSPTASGNFTYTVTATGTCAPAIASGTITINPLPQGTLSANGPLCSSGTGQLTWTATSGSGPFTIVYSDGTVNHTVSNISSGASFNVYGDIITATTNYTLVAVTDNNGCSRTSGFTGASATLTVYAPPAITTDPISQTVCSTFPVNFSVSATGDGLSYQWYKDGQPLSDNTFISGSATNMLTIDPTSTGDAGSYYVVVKGLSPCDVATSATATLIINQQININQQPTASQTLCEGTTANFTVAATGTSLTYQWRKGTTNLTDAGSISGTTTSTLTIGNITTSDAANNYNVVISDIGNVCPTAFSNKAKLVVNRNSTLTMSSAQGTEQQTVCVNTPITNITYIAGGGATGASVTGLPSGVTASYNSGVVTISGTPVQSGTFNYTVITQGPCVNPSLTGTIIVNPNSTLTLTSAAASTSQTVCINTPIANITYAIGGSGTGAMVSGLPTGVAGSYDNGIVTISGTPTEAGTFNFKVTVSGPCVNPSLTGTLTINPNSTITLTSGPSSQQQTVCIDNNITAITYSTGGSATGVTISGLPTGVTGIFNAGIVTISGTPTASGTFPYTVTTTGPCSNITATGIITVTPNATLSLASANNNQTVCINTAIDDIIFNAGGSATGVKVSGLPSGVTGFYNAGTFKISGTPNVSGSYNYTVTAIGPCVNPTLSGTLTVNSNATISLTSAAATDNQTVCISNAINPITYSIGGSGNGATVTGLPAGIAGSYNAGVLTISGIPTVAGTFYYSVTTAGPCINTTVSGTITVNPNATIILFSGNNVQTVCINNAITNVVYNLGGGATGAIVSNLPAGVTGSYSAGKFTISGIPSQSGTFNYTVTATGPCVNPSLSGTITVNANSTITLTSSASTTAQTVCINTAITAITYKIAGSGTGAIVTGLPSGVTAIYNSSLKVLTISGSPSVYGSFNYLVTTTGPCVNASLSGTIKISPASIGGTVSPAITSACSGSGSGTITLAGNTGNVIRWEYSNNGGSSWTSISNTSSTLNYSNLTQTTLYRAVVQSSPCSIAYSTNAVISIIPSYPPTSVSATPSVICAGDVSTLTTASGYPDIGFTNGTFNLANPKGWCRDGQCSGSFLPADGDKQDTGVWRETNDHTFQGVYYSSPDYKFAIADGNFTSSIETPVFSLIGQSSVSLMFLQAYILQTTATKAIITISTDGGMTYNDTLAKYVGTSSLGMNATKDTATMQNMNIPLTNYIGLSNLRIKFTYVGSTKSSWVLDNIQVPATLPITYQWTPTETLTPSTGIGQTVTAQPTKTTTYTVTTMVGGCPGGSASVTVTVNPLPTITGISTVPVCEGTNETISLTGLIPNSTSTITYNIAGTQATVTVISDGSGNGSFTIPVSSANNGQLLTITSISNNTTPCGKTFNISVPLSINKRPTAVLSGDQIMCSNQPATLTVTLTGTAPWSITYTDGTNAKTINNVTSNPFTFNVSPSVTSVYHITAVSDANCTAIATDLTGTATVTVLSGPAGLWTGAADKDWFNCRNWADGNVPGISTNVTIDQTAIRPCEIDAGTSPYAASFNYVASSRNITVSGNDLTFLNLNRTDTLIAAGDVTIRNDGVVDMTTGGKAETWGNWIDEVATVGKGFIDGYGTVIFSNAATQRIFATKGTELFHNLRINKTATTELVYLYDDVTVENDLVLTSGIFVTDYHLFTWNNTGSLYAPEPSYTPKSLNYTKSFIATCDTLGIPINVANATTAFQGNAGFQIKNVGNSNTYFPVGASFKPSATGEVPAPNRMMIKNDTIVPQDFTVVVNIGDIGYTSSPVVERIWYVKSNGGKATMQLFFTKRYWTGWPTDENEVESGFDYSQAALIQKDYQNNVINLAAGSDIQNLLNVAQYPYNTEAYGIYTIGVSNNLSDGIVQFNRFSIVNPVNILVLPVNITNFRAYKSGKDVRIDWTAENQLNIDHYEVERSLNGIDFNSLSIVNTAENRPVINYSSFDKSPVSGINYYRVKTVSKDGSVKYTSVAIVNINATTSSLTIYPNPVTNKIFNVQLTNLPSGKYQLLIYNSLGKTVYSRTIENTGGSTSEQILLPSSLSAGTYFIKVLNGNYNFSAPVILL